MLKSCSIRPGAKGAAEFGRDQTWAAQARAIKVFPVPGGPYNKIPCGDRETAVSKPRNQKMVEQAVADEA